MAVRSEEIVSGPSGKKTAVASTSVIISSSAHSAGAGRLPTRTSGSRVTSSLRTWSRSPRT